VWFHPSPSQRKSKEKQKNEKKKSCGPKFLIKKLETKKKKKEAKTKGTKSQNARQFFGGPGDLKLRKENKTFLKFRNQLATQKKNQEKIIKIV
jgi:hypothetical protein